MQFLEPKLNSYLSNLHSHLIPELAELEKETQENIPMPQMLGGKELGAFLRQLILMKNPKLAIEIGTYTGYSAICMALSMQEGSELHTMDKNEEIVEISSKYFELSGQDKKIKAIQGNAMDLLKGYEENSVDFIFVDADKSNYSNYFLLCDPLLKSGGVMVFDNMLWSGKVAEENQDNRTKAIVACTKLVFSNDNYDSSLIPLRDGVLVARKK